jgi:hypothetical protein
VHVYDHNKSGPKPGITAALGATYHSDAIDELAKRLAPDIVIECTGVPDVVARSCRRSHRTVSFA